MSECMDHPDRNRMADQAPDEARHRIPPPSPISREEMARLLATVRTLEVTGDITIAGARALRILITEGDDEWKM